MLLIAQTQHSLDDCVRLAIERNKRIEIVGTDFQSAYSKYKLLSDNVSIFEKTLKMADEKYALGVATYYDYQTAINNLYQARYKESQAAFEYMLRKMILELYQNH